jgi:hypothetical protein
LDDSDVSLYLDCGSTRSTAQGFDDGVEDWLRRFWTDALDRLEHRLDQEGWWKNLVT